MKGFIDAHSRLSKPDARELDRRTREAGLLGAIKLFAEDPPIENFTGPTVWVSLQNWSRLKCFDGTQVIVLASSGMSQDRGDVDVTLTLDDAPTQYFRTPLTANRTIALPNDAENGDHFRIVRRPDASAGAFTLAVGSLWTIPSGTKASVTVEHDGTAWYLVDYSSF